MPELQIDRVTAPHADPEGIRPDAHIRNLSSLTTSCPEKEVPDSIYQCSFDYQTYSKRAPQPLPHPKLEVNREKTMSWDMIGKHY